MTSSAVRRRAGALAAAFFMTGCQRAPRPLVADTDACDYCRMTISDVRFGAELESRTGKIHTFDAIECLASYFLDAADRNDVRHAWVTDFEHGRFVPVDSAIFLEASSIRSPMGRSLFAFAPGTPAVELERRYRGRALAWADVVDLARANRPAPGAKADSGHGHGGSG